VARCWQNRRQADSLIFGELLGRNAVVIARGGLGAENSGTPFDDVQVELEDAVLGEQQLDEQR
jgi:hypothetical protein